MNVKVRNIINYLQMRIAECEGQNHDHLAFGCKEVQEFLFLIKTQSDQVEQYKMVHQDSWFYGESFYTRDVEGNIKHIPVQNVTIDYGTLAMTVKVDKGENKS